MLCQGPTKSEGTHGSKEARELHSTVGHGPRATYAARDCQNKISRARHSSSQTKISDHPKASRVPEMTDLFPSPLRTTPTKQCAANAYGCETGTKWICPD